MELFFEIYLTPLMLAMVTGIVLYHFSDIRDKISKLDEKVSKLNDTVIGNDAIISLFKDSIKPSSSKE